MKYKEFVMEFKEAFLNKYKNDAAFRIINGIDFDHFRMPHKIFDSIILLKCDSYSNWIQQLATLNDHEKNELSQLRSFWDRFNSSTINIINVQVTEIFIRSLLLINTILEILPKDIVHEILSQYRCQ